MGRLAVLALAAALAGGAAGVRAQSGRMAKVVLQFRQRAREARQSSGETSLTLIATVP